MSLRSDGAGGLDRRRLERAVDDAVAIAAALQLPASELRGALIGQIEGNGPRASRNLALERLLERYPTEPESVTLARANLHDASGRARLLAACVAGTEEGREVLRAMAQSSRHGFPLQCVALVRVGGREAEDTPLELLKGDEGAFSIIDALGKVGSPRAVAPLQRQTVSADRCRTAIAAIQARHEGRGGGLALAEGGDAGRLALASEAPAGALSKERS